MVELCQPAGLRAVDGTVGLSVTGQAKISKAVHVDVRTEEDRLDH